MRWLRNRQWGARLVMIVVGAFLLWTCWEYVVSFIKSLEDYGFRGVDVAGIAYLAIMGCCGAGCILMPLIWWGKGDEED